MYFHNHNFHPSVAIAAPWVFVWVFAMCMCVYMSAAMRENALFFFLHSFFFIEFKQWRVCVCKTIFGLVYPCTIYVYSMDNIYNSYAEIYVVQSVYSIVYSLLVTPKYSSVIRWSESLYRVAIPFSYTVCEMLYLNNIFAEPKKGIKCGPFCAIWVLRQFIFTICRDIFDFTFTTIAYSFLFLCWFFLSLVQKPFCPIK